MDDFDLQQRQLDQRRLLANQLRNTEIPQGRMVGRIYVRQPGETIAAALRQYAGMKELEDVDKSSQELSQRRRDTEQADLQKFAQALRGTPEMTNAPATPMDDEGNVMPTTVTPAQKGDPYAAYSQLSTSMIPALRQAGLQGLSQFPQMEARQAEREAERQFRREAQQENIQARRELAQQAAADRRQLAAITAGNRPEKMVTVVGAEGQPVTMPQSQAAGMTPYNPTVAKQAKQQAEQGQARQQLSDAVGELRSYYDTLKSQGGIVSQDQGVLGNIGARIGSTPGGQLIGGALGTKSQETRQKIEQTRPLLLNLIKNATGMSAQQMNSNAEMQLYLRAATDPTLSYEANQQALNNLDKMFGLGIGTGQPQAPAPAAQGKVRRFNPATGQLE